ncbi:hypothetical protein I3760_12G115900 [Carya illinoinensis]|nr:hypothetical protein I3760_12G115900 [Carya illinoinensis]
MILFTTIFQRVNAVAEGRNVTSVLPENTGDKKNASTNYEAKDQAQRINDDDDMSGVTGFVVDTARQCVTKAMDRAEDVGETVKEAMDSAFDVTKETTSIQNMKDTVVVVADTNVVDTTEYRSIQDAAKHAFEGASS